MYHIVSATFLVFVDADDVATPLNPLLAQVEQEEL
jgi:hypothetical protein